MTPSIQQNLDLNNFLEKSEIKPKEVLTN